MGLNPTMPLSAAGIRLLPPGIGTEAGDRHSRGDRHRRTAAAAAGDEAAVVGVPDRSEGCVAAGDAEGELVHVGLAYHNGARGLQAGHGRRVLGGNKRFEERRTGGVGQTGGVDVVLDRNRNSMQRAEDLAVEAQLIQPPGAVEGALAIERNECVQEVLAFGCLQGTENELLARQFSPGHRLMQVRNGRQRARFVRVAGLPGTHRQQRRARQSLSGGCDSHC